MKKMKKVATKKMMYGGKIKKSGSKKMQGGGELFKVSEHFGKGKMDPGITSILINGKPWTPVSGRKVVNAAGDSGGDKTRVYQKKQGGVTKKTKKMQLGGMTTSSNKSKIGGMMSSSNKPKSGGMMSSSNASEFMSSGLKRGVRKPKLGAKMEMLSRKNGGMTKKKKSY